MYCMLETNTIKLKKKKLTSQISYPISLWQDLTLTAIVYKYLNAHISQQPLSHASVSIRMTSVMGSDTNSAELKFTLWPCISITYNSCETDPRSISQDPFIFKDPCAVKIVETGKPNMQKCKLVGLKKKKRI